MHTSETSAVYDRWTQPRYEIRVRGTIHPTYLWGSAGITKDIKFYRPLVLHIRNDAFGEAVTFGTRLASGVQTNLGTLGPGECVSIPVQDISGVFATCTLESTVGCLLKGDN
jgi:hypothetical protein